MAYAGVLVAPAQKGSAAIDRADETPSALTVRLESVGNYTRYLRQTLPVGAKTGIAVARDDQSTGMVAAG